jgi:hypothetical protein
MGTVIGEISLPFWHLFDVVAKTVGREHQADVFFLTEPLSSLSVLIGKMATACTVPTN